MLKKVLGVIAGFLVWSILWVGVDALLKAVWVDYNKSVEAMNFTSMILFVPLILSAVCSIIAGSVTALIAKENFKSPLILGVLLLIIGIFVQMGVWDKIPLWYHLAFWALLIPMTVFGGKLTQSKYNEVRRNY
jgi:MFS family permease